MSSLLRSVPAMEPMYGMEPRRSRFRYGAVRRSSPYIPPVTTPKASLLRASQEKPRSDLVVTSTSVNIILHSAYNFLLAMLEDGFNTELAKGNFILPSVERGQSSSPPRVKAEPSRKKSSSRSRRSTWDEIVSGKGGAADRVAVEDDDNSSSDEAEDSKDRTRDALSALSALVMSRNGAASSQECDAFLKKRSQGQPKARVKGVGKRLSPDSGSVTLRKRQRVEDMVPASLVREAITENVKMIMGRALDVVKKGKDEHLDVLKEALSQAMTITD